MFASSRQEIGSWARRPWPGLRNWRNRTGERRGVKTTLSDGDSSREQNICLSAISSSQTSRRRSRLLRAKYARRASRTLFWPSAPDRP